MGKRRRKINNPKFATKFAQTRETHRRLLGKTIVETTTESVIEEVEDPIIQVTEPKPVVEASMPVIKKTNALKSKNPTTKKTTTKKPTTKKTTTTSRKRRTTKAKAET